MGGYRLHEAVNLNAVSQLLTDGTGLLPKLIAGIAAAAMITALVFAWRGPLKTDSKRFALQFSMAVLAIPLLSPHFYIYDLTIMLLPFLLIAWTMRSAEADARPDSGRKPTLHKFALYTISAFFLVSGFFSAIAEATRIQLAADLLVMLIGTAALYLSPAGWGWPIRQSGWPQDG